MAQFFETNLGTKSTNCLEWLECFFKCCNLSEIRTKEVEIVQTKTFHIDKISRQRTPRIKHHRVLKNKIVKGREQCFRYMMDLARSFCSYIKHGERGKLKRRAIASANIILRMFLFIIEDFHLRLSKRMAGSTIAIGGEEKKQKITLSMHSAILENQEMTKRVQATQDATKWNEMPQPRHL